MKFEHLLEARRNPEQNQRQRVNPQLQRILDNTTDFVGDTPNAFISLTALNKLGINPMTDYNTPLGIYSYPLQYVMDEIQEEYDLTQLPFAGDQPYVNIFSVQGNVINLTTITEQQCDEYYHKLYEFFGKNIVDTKIHQSTTDALVNSPGGCFWYVTRELSNENPAKWNKIFRLLDIDGCVDNGSGIIHEHEQTQAVFFSIKSIKSNKLILNSQPVDSYFKNKVKNQSIKVGKAATLALKNVNNIDDFLKIASDKPYYIAKIKNDKLRTEFLRKVPTAIRYIKNPSPQHQLIAFIKNINTIGLVNNPNKKAVVSALREHGSVPHTVLLHLMSVYSVDQYKNMGMIKYILNIDPGLVEKIPNPSYALVKFAYETYQRTKEPISFLAEPWFKRYKLMK